MLKITGSARDAIEEALRRADQPAAEGVFTFRADSRARKEAAAADASPERPPYRGVPITIKDNVDIAGEVTTAGSKVLAVAAPATVDAPIAARLKRAGFINIGRTNMTEFAFAALGVNPHYGTPRNPAFPGEHRIPGGSSSGAAVSVALDIVPMAIGSDTGGSVRVPAAFCGITGFKPTFGAITNDRTYPLAPSLDTLGVLAHSVADCAATFDVIRDRPGSARTARSLRGARLAVIENYLRGNTEDAVARAFDAACAKLADAGAVITPLVLPEIDEIPVLNKNGTMVMAEGYRAVKDVIAGREAQCDPRVITRVAGGGRMTEADYTAIITRRAQLQVSAAGRLAPFDAYLMPTVAIIAPTLASVQDPDAYAAANALILRNATVGNFLGHCAISIPCQARGAAPVGLSVGMLGGRDDALLTLAEAVELELRH